MNERQNFIPLPSPKSTSFLLFKYILSRGFFIIWFNEGDCCVVLVVIDVVEAYWKLNAYNRTDKIEKSENIVNEMMQFEFR